MCGDERYENDIKMGHDPVFSGNSHPVCPVQENVLRDTAFAGDHVWNDSISYCNAAADRACIPVCDAEQSGLQKEMVSGRQAGNGCI